MRWPSFAVPSVRSDMICVWPRVKRPEPCVRGETLDLALDRADLLRRRDRPGGACRRRSSCGRAPCRSPRRPSSRTASSARPSRPTVLAVGRPGTAASTVSMIWSKSSARLADLSSFESCSASVSACSSASNCSRTGAFDGVQAELLEEEREARAGLRPPDDVVLGRVHRDLAAELRLELVDERAGARGGRPRRSWR